MKNLILFLFFNILASVILAQKVVISCGPGENCLRPNPESFAKYTGNINNFGTTGFLWNIDSSFWVAKPTTELSNPNGSELSKTGAGNTVPDFDTRWKNTSNSINATNNQKKVILTLKVSRNETVNGVNQVVRKFISDSVIVNVKFLGAIASASSPSINNGAAFTDGQTVGLPCTTQPFTVTVPTPANGTGQVNDPAVTINYTWSLPNGWSGSSNTNSIAITPPASGDVTIFVDAKRSDGTKIQSFSFKVSRASFQVGDPTINFTYGSPITCAGDTRLMTGAAANATSFVWSPINTGIIYTPNAATGMIKFNSNTTLTLTVDNGCGQPKTVSKIFNVGPPIFSTATVNGAPQQTPNYIQNPAYLSVNSDELTASFSYNIAAYNGSITQIPWSPGGRSVYAYAYPFVQIQAKAENICGINTTMFFLYNVTSYYRMASPNPTQNTISVEMEKELGQQALVSVKLISHGRNSVERSFTDAEARRTNHFERSNKVDFDVSNLPRGTYYLMIDFKGEKKFKEIIVLN